MLAYRHGFKSSSLPWQEDTVSLYLPFHSRHLRPVFLCFCYSVFLPDRFLFSLIPATLAFNFFSVSTVQPCCTVRCCFVFPLLFARRRPSVLAASLPFCSPPFSFFPDLPWVLWWRKVFCPSNPIPVAGPRTWCKLCHLRCSCIW